MAWISPTGHNDPDGKWTIESDAYDDDTGSYAQNLYFDNDHYLELTHSAIACDKVQIYAADYVGADPYNPNLDIDVYYSGGWHNIFSGIITRHTWVEKSIGSTQLVTKARIKSNTGTRDLRLYEFDFNKPFIVETDACSNPTPSSLQANGDIVSDGGKTVTRRGFHYSKVFDGFEWGGDTDPLSDCGGAIDWSITAEGDAKAEIDTAQHYSGTRSARLYRSAIDTPSAWFSQSPMSVTQVVSIWYRRTGTVQLAWSHGNGSYRFYVNVYSDGSIRYYDTAYRDTGYDIAADEQHHLEIKNVDWDNHQFDIYLDGICIKTDAGMNESSSRNGIMHFQNAAASSEFWLDNVAVWDVEDESDSFGEGEYSLEITGLDPATTYYVQAFAENAAGFGYGAMVTCRTVIDEKGRLQVILGVQAKSDIAIMAETAKIQEVLAVQGRTDLATFLDEKEQIILAAQNKGEQLTEVETREQAILGVIDESDLVTFLDTLKSQVILATVGESDLATFLEALKFQTVLAIAEKVEQLIMVEAREQVALGIIDETDLVTVLETLKSQVILATTGEIDLATFLDTLKVQTILAAQDGDAIPLFVYDETGRLQIILATQNSVVGFRYLEVDRLQIILAEVGGKIIQIISHITKPPVIHDLGKIKPRYTMGSPLPQVDYTLGDVKKGTHNLGRKVE